MNDSTAGGVRPGIDRVSLTQVSWSPASSARGVDGQVGGVGRGEARSSGAAVVTWATTRAEAEGEPTGVPQPADG